jgi:hypothetical protein
VCLGSVEYQAVCFGNELGVVRQNLGSPAFI